MGNSKRGHVTVTIGGESYTLVYNNGAVTAIEARFGNTALSVLMKGEPSRSFIVEALRVGLEKFNRNHTQKKIFAMLDADPECYNQLMIDIMCGLYSFSMVSDEKIADFRKEVEAANDEEDESEPPSTTPGDEAEDVCPTSSDTSPGGV